MSIYTGPSCSELECLEMLEVVDSNNTVTAGQTITNCATTKVGGFMAEDGIDYKILLSAALGDIGLERQVSVLLVPEKE